MSSKSATEMVDLSTLTLEQLRAFYQQLEEEMMFLSRSMTTLKIAQQKYSDSKDCVADLTPACSNKDVMVPLSTSMYVSGQLSDVENVIADIGTGYYVEMSVKKAEDYFKRKVEYLTKQLEQLQPRIQEKYKMKQATQELMQMKVSQHIQAQQLATQGGKS